MIFLKLLFTFISCLIFFNVNAQSLPSFVLACSYGGGQPLYRVASNGSEIYFASTFNEVNLNAASKSFQIVVEERRIIWKMIQGDGSSGDAVLDRDTLTLRISSSLSRSSYGCNIIKDNEIFRELKSRYDAKLKEYNDKRNTYNNRPNKL